MTKSVATCKMCHRTRYVNYAGLCKRCNKNPASQDIKEHVMEERQDALAMQQDRQDALESELQELLALEESGSLSDEQTVRLEQLRGGDSSTEEETDSADSSEAEKDSEQ